MVARRFAKFMVVGGIGFLVDAGVLVVAVRYLTPSVYAARALSFTVAVFATWLLNRTFVFATGQDERPIAGEYARYLTTQVIGALSNLLVFFMLIEALPILQSSPVIPLAAGAVLGALVNYAGAAWWVFRPKRRRCHD